MTSSWRDDAACRDMDLDLWFPATGESHKAAEAKAICATCPVAVDCLAEAKAAHIRCGIWGGKTLDERQRSRRYGKPMPVRIVPKGAVA